MDHSRVGGFFYLIFAVFYMVCIYLLSSIPADSVAPGLAGVIAWTPPALQNLLHIPMFGILAWLWYRTLCAWITAPPLVYLLTFVVTGGYGILDEWHQLSIPGRHASLTDIALDIFGAATALWLIANSERLTRKTGARSTE